MGASLQLWLLRKEHKNRDKMEEELKIYIDAIKGMEPNMEMGSKYIPNKYRIPKLFGEGMGFLLEKFTKDWDSSGKIVDRPSLEALYKLLNFGPEVMALYENFDPRCQAQILYDKYKEKYVKGHLCSSINESKLDDCQKVIYNELNKEMSYTTEFSVMHRLGCENTDIRDVLVSNGFFSDECFIPKEEMEEMAEKKLTDKMFDVIDTLLADILLKNKEE